MNRPLIACAVLLGVSLLVNAMAIGRLLAPADAPPPSRAPMIPAAHPPRDDGALDRLKDEIAMLRQEVAALRGQPLPPEAAPRPPASPAPRVRDPKIAEALGESEAIDALFSDLGRLERRREELGKDKYSQTLLESTADTLGLTEPARSRFIGAAQQASFDLESAWKIHEDARKALPPFDATNREANREQVQAMNKAFTDQVKAAAEKLNAVLDAAQPAQKVFMAKTEQYAVNYLAPSGADRIDRFDRGMRRINR